MDKTMDEEDRGIKVYLRIRPSKSSSKYFLRDDLDENMITFKIPKLENLIVNNSRTLYNFKFHGILEQNATQEEVFNKVGKSAVQNILNGFNSTVFTYGQTGSGKTFTITGGPARYADRGIIPRSISTLFAEFQRRKDDLFSCHVSYLEIYNDKGYDLLSDEHSQITNLEEMRKVSILEDEEGGFHFRNLSVHPVTSEEEALNLLFLGDTNRAIGETAMNLTSSRSHCIFVLGLEARAVGSELVTRSKLNLVDLAGSERVHKTNSYGQTLNEAKAINSSLFFLEMVIVALQERDMHGRERTHIPYRNSMMTSVLRDSLGGNCKTLMIATISSETSQTDESISTCSFAQRVALVKNTASVNQELEPLLVIRRLKADIIKLREEIKFLKGESGDDGLITELQRDELNRAIKCYINDRDQRTELNIGSITITKLNEAFRLFKSIAQEMQQSAEGRPIQEDKTYSEESSVVDVEKNITKFQNTQPQRHDEVVDCNKDKDVIHHLRPLGIKPTKSDSSNDHNGFLLHQNQVVGGVNRCPDRAIVEDPAAAFLWFKTRYPGIKAIDENKDLLKEKVFYSYYPYILPIAIRGILLTHRYLCSL
mmetsp:Transcript_27944/g.39996  ORF Transcript_27944/g.39996 Transcript_27944/m.39996 type:complete len:596 (+) Transcript_27944:316-2103(+)